MPKKSLDLVKMENEKLMKDKEMEAKFAMLNKEMEEVPVSVSEKKRELVRKKLKKLLRKNLLVLWKNLL